VAWPKADIENRSQPSISTVGYGALCAFLLHFVDLKLNKHAWHTSSGAATNIFWQYLLGHPLFEITA